jgi:hypothetical protein
LAQVNGLGLLAVISVTADLTVWTDGNRLWCTVSGLAPDHAAAPPGHHEP